MDDSNDSPPSASTPLGETRTDNRQPMTDEFTGDDPLAGGEVWDRFALKLGEMARMWRTLTARHLKPFGVSFTQWHTLLYLSLRDSDVVQRELALAIGVEEPALVGVLDRLVAAGLVERRVAAHDRRAKTVHMTAQARTLLAQADGELHKMRECLLAGLEVDELEACIAIFDRISRQATEAGLKPPDPA